MSDSDSDKETSKQEENDDAMSDKEVEDETTFADLGIVDVLCDAAKSLGWKKPTKIQKESIPVAI